MLSTKHIANTKMRGFSCTFYCKGFSLQNISVRLSTNCEGSCMKDLFFSTVGEALSRHNLSWHWRLLICQAHLGSVTHRGSQHREHSWCWRPDLHTICISGVWLLGFIGVRGSAPLAGSGQIPWAQHPLATMAELTCSWKLPNCFSPKTKPAHALKDWSLALSRACSWGWVGELDSDMHYWPN